MTPEERAREIAIKMCQPDCACKNYGFSPKFQRCLERLEHARIAAKMADDARNQALREAAEVARKRGKVCNDGAQQYAEGTTDRASEICAGIEAAYIARLIEALMEDKP